MDKEVLNIAVLALQIALAVVMWRRGKNGKDDHGNGTGNPVPYPDQPMSRREAEHAMRGLAQAVLSVIYFMEKHDYEAARRSVTDWAGVRDTKFQY